ncbi:MAG TPA: delta-60 repeat domain-containing protein, partial [Blastocatellia bacterium]|nr:delta-60 repeat domain-containing protein [Blastocatellia bacterium]
MSRFNSCRSRPARVSLALVITSVLLAASPPGHVDAAAGDLDPTFGNGGKVSTDFFGMNDAAHAMIVQGDGKIVVAGFYNSAFSAGFALVRYLGGGGLDPSFGGTGKVLTDFSGNGDGALAVALQSNGKIIAAGAAQGSPNPDFGLARYNSNG